MKRGIAHDDLDFARVLIHQAHDKGMKNLAGLTGRIEELDQGHFRLRVTLAWRVFAHQQSHVLLGQGLHLLILLGLVKTRRGKKNHQQDRRGGHYDHRLFHLSIS